MNSEETRKFNLRVLKKRALPNTKMSRGRDSLEFSHAEGVLESALIYAKKVAANLNLRQPHFYLFFFCPLEIGREDLVFAVLGE